MVIETPLPQTLVEWLPASLPYTAYIKVCGVALPPTKNLGKITLAISTQTYYTMKMVGHEDVFHTFNIGEDIRQFIVTFLQLLGSFVHNHLSVMNVSEQTQPFIHNDCYEIVATRGIVVIRQAHCLALRQLLFVCFFVHFNFVCGSGQTRGLSDVLLALPQRAFGNHVRCMASDSFTKAFSSMLVPSIMVKFNTTE